MNKTMPAARPTLRIAAALLLLLTAGVLSAQQTPAPASDNTTTPTTTSTTPATTQTVPAPAQTEKSQGQSATEQPKPAEHKWQPAATTTSALPGMQTAPTTNGTPTGTKATTGSAISQPSSGKAPLWQPGSTTNALPGTDTTGSAIQQPGTVNSSADQWHAPSSVPNAVSGSTGSAIDQPSVDAKKWHPGTTNSAVPNIPNSADATDSGMPQPTAISDGQPATNTPNAVSGSTGSAIDQPGVDAQKWHPGTTNSAVPNIPNSAGATDSGTPQPSAISNDQPVNTPNTVTGSTGSAITQPGDVGDAEKWQPGTESSNALPGVKEAATTNGTTASPATGAAINNANKLEERKWSPTGSPNENAVQMMSPNTNFSTTVTDEPGTAINQPATTSGTTTVSGDIASGMGSSKGVTEEVHHWVPASDTSSAINGETKQPTMITPGTAAGDTPNTNTAIDPSKVSNTDKKWLPDNDPNKAVPNAGEFKKPTLFTPGTAPGEQPNTNTAIDQPSTSGAHVWQPDSATNVAVDVNLEQPQMFVPGVAKGQQPYIHTAVEAPHGARRYQYKRGTGQAVEKIVLVPQVDTRNFGNAMRQMTPEGHIVIDMPVGWRRTAGPALLYFVPDKTPKLKNPLRSYEAAIYVGNALIEPNELDRDSLTFSSADAFIHSDIAGFKARFKRALVKESPPFPLPLSKARHVTYSFQSREGDNAYEEVIYIDEGDRVLALTLSASNPKTFWSLVPVFHKFAQSYQGNIADGLRTPVQ